MSFLGKIMDTMRLNDDEDDDYFLDDDYAAVPAHGRTGIFCKRMHPLTAFCLLAPF